MSWHTPLASALYWIRALTRNVYFWIGLGALLAIGVAAFFFVDSVIMPSYTRHDVSIRVPNVEDQPFEEAKTTMQNKGLNVRREVGRYNPNVDRGTVVDQKPLPRTTVKPGRRVYLTVNAGEVPVVKIPDLNGMSVREARNRVSSIGLTVDTVRPDSIPSPYANTITKQSPLPGDSVRTGEGVQLWYSTGLGDTTVVVPNVVGETVATAQEHLLGDKLRYVIVDTTISESRTHPRRATDTETQSARPQTLYVQRQGHSPGSSVPAGTAVRLFVTADSNAIPRPDTPTDTTNADADPASTSR